MLTLNAARRCKCAEHCGIERWHGSSAGYDNHACRCEDCKAAHLKKTYAWRQRNREAHLENKRRYRERNRNAVAGRHRIYRQSLTALRGDSRIGLKYEAWEDEIVMRPDLSSIEAAALVKRTVEAVYMRRAVLRKLEVSK